MENQPEKQFPMQDSSNLLPQRSRFSFSEPREPAILFSSDFDSGNMHRVERVAYDHYCLWTASDAQGTSNEGYPKSWFYFKVGGFSNRRVNFSIHRVHFLYAMCKRPQMYRPAYRIFYQHGQVSDWDRLPYPVSSLGLNDDDELVLKFDFLFNKLISNVEFAFIYPYSYQQCRKDIKELDQKYHKDRQLFLGVYQLAKSYQKRSIEMLIISSYEGRQGFQVGKNLPFGEQKIARFRSNKPIIFISARVHPIQTPSSFTIQGIISFLLDKKDARAYFLRKYFVFVLVPMLNPDGVARGHCRMDSLNQNLNRYYTNPDPQLQPSCFAVKKLCEHYSKDKRLFMYLDLHAHPAYKGNFTFGNAIYEFVQQVQSQLFPKVLAQNCISFEFQQCIFSRKHMKAKDRNEDFSKQGCGRVVFYKEFGLVHSYTLECGYHLNAYDNQLEPERNYQQSFAAKYRLNDAGQKIYQLEKQLDNEKLQNFIEDVQKQQGKRWDIFGITPHGLDSKDNEYYKRQIPLYTLQTFRNLGRNILISILDIWNKNPYSRLADMNANRREIAEKQSKLDRFRKQQTGIKAKQKKIVELIEEQFYGQWHKRNIFNPGLSSGASGGKKRNQTLQLGKVHTLRPQKSQKDGRIEEMAIYSGSQTQIEGEIRQSRNFNLAVKDEKYQTGSEVIIQAKIYARNFKLNRTKLTNSANQNQQRQRQSKDNRGPSINKQLVAAQIKISLEQEVTRLGKQEGLSLSSKMVRSGIGGLRVRLPINKK